MVAQLKRGINHIFLAFSSCFPGRREHVMYMRIILNDVRGEKKTDSSQYHSSIVYMLLLAGVLDLALKIYF